MEEFTEDGVTRKYAPPEPASGRSPNLMWRIEPGLGTISESEPLDSVDDGDLPFRHTRPYFSGSGIAAIV